MNQEESANQRPTQTFEQILELLYKEHRKLEVEYRKLYEYRQLENQYRAEEQAKKQEEQNKLIEEYRKLADQYKGLELKHVSLETEYKTLADKYGPEEQFKRRETEEFKKTLENSINAENKFTEDERENLEEKHKNIEDAVKRLEEENKELADNNKKLETKLKDIAVSYKKLETDYKVIKEAGFGLQDDRLKKENQLLNEKYIDLENEYYKLELKYKRARESASLNINAGPTKNDDSRVVDDEYKNLESRFRKLDRTYRRLVVDSMRLSIMYKSTERLRDANEAEKELQHFYNYLLLQSCSEIIFVVDRELRVVLATETLARMLGVPDRSQIINQTLAHLFASRIQDEAIIEMLKNCRNVFETSAPTHFTRRLDLNDGYEMTADITMTPALGKNGENHGVVFVIHDITELDNAKKRAEEASRSKSSFLATVSHEIRTPLNAILGISEIEIQKELAPETKDSLEKIYSSGSSLLSIINDILDISKIESGSMEIIPTNYDTSSLISSSIQLNLVRKGTKKIDLELDIDPSLPYRLNGDELRVKQILNNLLSNAFKYTEEGFVKLALAWKKEGQAARVTFVVSDSGQGIRQEDIGKLFTEFKQLNARANRNIEGTGLGLSITQRLVELMNGSISVESEFGKGSIFTVNIFQEIIDETPIGDAAVTNIKEFRFAEYKNKRKKNLIRSYMPYGCVLVVDDVVTNLEVAKGLLLPYGLKIDCVKSGGEAIERIKSAGERNSGAPRYDVVLMDHMMPVMDGIEATAIIRNLGTEYARNVPIIALTANAMSGSEEMFLKNGFNAYISKPIDIMRLDVELNKWIRDKQREETLTKAEHPQIAEESPERIETEEHERTSSSLRKQDTAETRVVGLDTEEGLTRFGEQNIYNGVLRSYVDNTPPLLDKMRIISRYKMPEYAITVHGIKGSSYGICANTAGKWAERLEMAAKKDDLETVLAENNDFIKMMERLLSDIKDYLDGSSSAKGNTRVKSYAPDRKILERILTASEMFDVQMMETGVQQLETQDYEFGADLVALLRSSLDNLEYAEIKQYLEKALQVSRKH